MAEQFMQEGYYASSEKKFVDTHRSNQVSIEVFLSKLLFKNDLSRVVYTTKDNAFRRRIETLDKGKNENAPLKPEMLDLPFACYFMAGDPEPDDRVAAVNAGEAVDGIYYEEEDRLMKTLAVKTKYKIICFFSRLDDVRKAQQLLMWEKEPKAPIWMYNYVQWRGLKVKLPTFMSIESINTTPEYQETDWLTKNRIFPIEIEITSRSYQLLINNVDKIIQLPMRFANYQDLFEEDEDNSELITEEVVLDWAARKFDMDIDITKVDTENEEYKLYSPYFIEHDMTDVEIATSCAIPNKHLTDSVRAYWEADTSCTLAAYQYDEVKSTFDKARIAFRVKPSTFKYFDHLELMIPTKTPVTISDCHATEAFIEGLYPNSEYKCTLTLHATDGTVQVYYLSFKTKDSPTNEAPQPEKINKTPGLVGMLL